MVQILPQRQHFARVQWFPLRRNQCGKTQKNEKSKVISFFLKKIPILPRVYYKFSPPDHPQIFDMHCPTTIVEGSNVTLHCNVTGNPLPNIVWILRYTGSVLGRSEKLTLTDVNRSQTGTYLCRAWNGIGSNSTRTCGLDVYCEQNIYPFSLLHETVGKSLKVTFFLQLLPFQILISL